MKTALWGALASGLVWGMAADAQQTISGSFDDPAFQQCVSASCSFAAFKLRPYQITVTDTAAFSVLFERDSIQNVFLVFQPGDFDPTSTAYLEMSYSEQWLPFPNSTSDFYSRATPPEGEYTLIVVYEELAWLPGPYGFLLTMNGLIVGWAPTTEEQLEEVKATLAQNGRNNLRILTSNVRGASQDSLATRKLSFSTKGDTAALMGNFYAWVKASSLYAESAGRSYRSPMLQLGGDVALGPSIVAGLSVGFGDISAKSTGFTYEGSQTLMQPYIGWNSGEWNGAASLVYGTIDYNTITTMSGTAGVKGEMLAIATEVSRDFVLDDSTTVSPFVGIETGQINLTATSGTLAGAGLGDTVTFTEARLGATLTKTFENGAFSFGLSADRFDTNAPTALSSGQYDSTGWSGGMQFGYSVNLGGRAMLDTGLKVGGIGSDTISYSGSVQVSMRF